MRRALMVAGVLALTACGAPAEPVATPTPSPSASPRPTATASATPSCDTAGAVAALPLDVKLRQLLFAGVFTGASDPMASANAAAAAGVGGINFLGNDPQVYADGELAAVTSAGGRFPPFLAVDQEGGRVQRLAPLIGSQPSARQMGATMTPAQVEELAAATGAAMKGLGLTMDLAPVADVSSQSDKAVIGDRAFSADPAKVSEFAGAYAEGLRSQGIIPVFKHFPGIGSASGNTDFEPATSPPLAQLRAVDMVPYAYLLEIEPNAVMMGTAVVPDLTDGEPAALSAAAVDLLRKDLAYNGVVMTDSLSGAAVKARYSLPQAAERALVAGVDMVLWDSVAEIDSILAQLNDAVTSGRLSAGRVDESFGRVLALKRIDACSIG